MLNRIDGIASNGHWKQKALNLDYDVSVSLAEHEMTYEWDGKEYDYQEIRLTISMKRKGGIIIIAPPGLLVVVSWVGFPILQAFSYQILALKSL